MSVVILRRLAVVVLLPLLLVLIGGCGAFPESRFKLASDSRLPKWFALPPGLSRSDVDVTMYYYITPWSGRTAEFELSDANGKKLAAVIGKQQGSAPISLGGASSSGVLYPTQYEIVTVNGMTEVIEHRQDEGAIFHITDDIEVLTKLGLK
jgi:hypothetical protein